MITRVSIQNLRNLLQVDVAPAPHFNLLYGQNGSGKTSFLEAIYYIGLGRSFRTRLNSRIINHEAQQFSLFAQIQRENTVLPVGIERQLNGECRIRIAQENARSIFEITQILPIRLLNPDSRELLTGGSKLRRQFIDWGVFHVEPGFLRHWQHAQRILKQRNAALRQGASKTMVGLWDHELETVAQTLHPLRQSYLEQLEPVFCGLLNHLLGEESDVTLTYKPGWDQEAGLLKVLSQSFERDAQLGYTQHGPQRADLVLRAHKNVPLHDVLSQGQQKLTVYALHLAQGILLHHQTHKRCVYLLDDLPAELDPQSRQRVATALRKIDAQVFITGVDRSALANLECLEGAKVFHVEQGRVGIVTHSTPFAMPQIQMV